MNVEPGCEMACRCLVFCCKHVKEHIWSAALGNAKEETKSPSSSLKSSQLDSSPIVTTIHLWPGKRKKKISSTLFTRYWPIFLVTTTPAQYPDITPPPSPECAHLSLLSHCLSKRMPLRFMSETFNMLREGRCWDEWISRAKGSHDSRLWYCPTVDGRGISPFVWHLWGPLGPSRALFMSI